MGVKSLWQIFGEVYTEKTPQNEVLAVDASIWIHRYRSIDNKSTVVFSILKRIVSLLFHGNELIFVFDGKTPEEKKLTVIKRNQQRILNEIKKHFNKIRAKSICKICSNRETGKILYQDCKHGKINLNEFEDLERLCSETLSSGKNIQTWGRLLEDEEETFSGSDEQSEVLDDVQIFIDKFKRTILQNIACPLKEILPTDFENFPVSKKLKYLERLREANAFFFPREHLRGDEKLSIFQIEKTTRSHEIQKMISKLADGGDRRIMSDYETVFSFERNKPGTNSHLPEEIFGAKKKIEMKDEKGSNSEKDLDLEQFFAKQIQSRDVQGTKKKSEEELNDMQFLESLKQKSEDSEPSNQKIAENEKREKIYYNSTEIRAAQDFDRSVPVQVEEIVDKKAEKKNKAQVKNLPKILNEQTPHVPVKKFRIDDQTHQVTQKDSEEVEITQETAKSDDSFQILSKEVGLNRIQEKNLTNLLEKQVKNANKVDIGHDLQNISNILRKILAFFNIKMLDAEYEADSLLGFLNSSDPIKSSAKNEIISTENGHSITNNGSKHEYIEKSELVNKVDAVITDDNDVFLFGAKRVYRHFFTPFQAKKQTTDSEYLCKFYELAQIEKKLELSRVDLIRLSVFLGSDYHVGTTGIGPKRAIEMVKKFKECGENCDEIAEDEKTKPKIDWKDVEQVVSQLKRIYYNENQKFSTVKNKLEKQIDEEKLKNFMDANFLTTKQRDEILFYVKKLNGSNLAPKRKTLKAFFK